MVGRKMSRPLTNRDALFSRVVLTKWEDRLRSKGSGGTETLNTDEVSERAS